ncbi:hypothetical protein JYT83_00040 [bacterium AH-315-F18]|nr:hypothetical protein [bacterium AH-315-F18]
MSDKDIRAELDRLDVQDLISRQRRIGRINLDKEFVVFWALKYQRAIALLKDNRRGSTIRRVAALVRDCTFSIYTLSFAPTPTYYPYTDVHVLDWYLGREHQSFPDLSRKTIKGLSCLTSDLLRFESESLTGFEQNHTKAADSEVIQRRILAIRDLVNAISEIEPERNDEWVTQKNDLCHFQNFEGYASEESRLSALVHLTGFPQTEFHDEFVFQRSIHISELCFFGIRMAIIETMESIRRSQLNHATQCLARARGYATTLHCTFKVLRTMPVPHFIDFRDCTGDASAIQSRNYQLMEAYYTGGNPEKAEVYGRMEHLKDLRFFSDPRFIHLGKVINKYQNETEEWEKLEREARALDRMLLTWRGLHLGFAKTYLPPEAPGTGATAGAPYLKSHLLRGLFSDTEIDLEIVSEMFSEFPEIPNLFRASTGHGIAPDDEIREHHHKSLVKPSDL